MTAVILSGLMLLPLTACGSASQTGSDAASSVEPEIVLDVAFENNSSEPIGAGWEGTGDHKRKVRWKNGD